MHDFLPPEPWDKTNAETMTLVAEYFSMYSAFLEKLYSGYVENVNGNLDKVYEKLLAFKKESVRITQTAELPEVKE